MKQSIPVIFLMVGALLGGGCATKKYVRQTVDPVSGKLDQVAQQTNSKIDQTNQNLAATKQNLEKDETELSATKERAMTADNKAGEAMSHADQAAQKADQASMKADQANRGLGDLRNTIANLDDYKQVNQATVNFKFNSDKLTPDGKQQLDQMVANPGQYKRFFIAVAGFTDSVGSEEYNNALSRRRADAVVEYLVAKHDIPIYRIHMVGLGKDKPLEDARTRTARAKNRRVEVTLYSADQGAMAMNTTGSGDRTAAGRGTQSSPQH